MEYKTAKRMEYLPFSGIRAVMEKATKMQQAGEKVIHLEIGRPDFDTPKKIKDAAYESLNAGHVFYTSIMELLHSGKKSQNGKTNITM